MELYCCVQSQYRKAKTAVEDAGIVKVHRKPADEIRRPGQTLSSQVLPLSCIRSRIGNQNPEPGCTVRFKFTERLAQFRGTQDCLLLGPQWPRTWANLFQ